MVGRPACEDTYSPKSRSNVTPCTQSSRLPSPHLSDLTFVNEVPCAPRLLHLLHTTERKQCKCEGCRNSDRDAEAGGPGLHGQDPQGQGDAIPQRCQRCSALHHVCPWQGWKQGSGLPHPRTPTDRVLSGVRWDST